MCSSDLSRVIFKKGGPTTEGFLPDAFPGFFITKQPFITMHSNKGGKGTRPYYSIKSLKKLLCHILSQGGAAPLFSKVATTGTLGIIAI